MMIFLGRLIRHGGMSPTWHMRLFRSAFGLCESRKYDQHFYVTQGATAQLKGDMIDDIRMPLTEWTSRHNRWSDAEVEELGTKESAGRVEAQQTTNNWDAVNRPSLRNALFGRDVHERRLYNNTPLFVRPFILFFYRYFIRLGFLDGAEGLIFWVLQTFWFRFLVDAKLFERRKVQRAQDSASDTRCRLDS